MNRLLTGCGVVSTAGVIAWSVLSDKHSGDGGTLGDWLTCPQTLSHCKPAPQTSSSSQPVDERIGTRNSQLAPHCKMCYIKVLASKPGSPEGAGREGKESLVHTDCACVKLYQDFWYIVYFPYISSVSYSQRGCSQSVYGGRSRHG